MAPGDWDVQTASHAAEVVQPMRKERLRRLEMVNGPDAPQTFILDKTTMLIGRLDECDITVGTSEISRRHMQLSWAEHEFSIRDLDSHNGTYLNGVRVHSATLRDGDTLQLGNAVFVYHED